MWTSAVCILPLSFQHDRDFTTLLLLSLHECAICTLHVQLTHAGYLQVIALWMSVPDVVVKQNRYVMRAELCYCMQYVCRAIDCIDVRST